jgi:hypothetical protein
VVDDQQRGNKWTFEISPQPAPAERRCALSSAKKARRRAWSWSDLPPTGAIGRYPRRLSHANILLAMRLKDLTYSADLPLTGELKGELGRDGLPTYFRGKVTAGAGHIIDSDTPDYPMAIDSADINSNGTPGGACWWPFKIISGSNRITLAHLEPPNGSIADWQLGFSGGTIVLAGADNDNP